MPPPDFSADADRRAVGDRIRDALNLSGHTRAWLAAELHLGNSSIYSVLNGSPGFDGPRAKVCEYLRLDPQGHPLPEAAPVPALSIPALSVPAENEEVELLSPAEVADALKVPDPGEDAHPDPDPVVPVPVPELSAFAERAARLGILAGKLFGAEVDVIERENAFMAASEWRNNLRGQMEQAQRELYRSSGSPATP